MEKITYGDDSDQFIEVHVPSEVKVDNKWIVLVHGGYWREKWDKTLSEDFIELFNGLGYKVVNVEYRRGEHKWPIPEEDVNQTIRTFKDSEHYNDEKITLIGHSVGGQLVLNNAHEADNVVALAPVTDVVYTKVHHLGDDAVQDYFGDAPVEELKAASPIERLPLQTTTLIIHGINDDKVEIETSFSYIEKNSASTIDLHAYADLPHMDCIVKDGPHIDMMLDWIEKH